MNLLNLTAKNFQSFRDLSYSFINNEPVLITGSNCTDESQESNGSGKSNLANIIEKCILNTTSKKVTDKNLVTWGEDKCELSLSIFCPIRKETLLIERTISVKSGGAAQLSINGVVKYAFVDKMVSEVDKDILNWIGISSEDLQNFFILSKFKYKSFFDSSNTALVQLIGRFSNSNIIEGIDKDILAEATKLEGQITDLKSKTDKIYGMIEAHKANLNTELTVDKKQKVNEAIAEIDRKIIEEGEAIIVLNATVNTENKKIEQLEDDLIGFLTSLQKCQKQLHEINAKNVSFDDKYQSIDDQISVVKKEKDEVEVKLNKASSNHSETMQMLREIDMNIKGSVKCPKCSHEFLVADPDIDIEEEKKAKLAATSIIDSLNKSIADIKLSLAEFTPRLSSLKADRTQIEAQEHEISVQKRNVSSSISALERTKDTTENSIKACENRIKNVKQQISDSESRITTLEQSKGKVSIKDFDNSERIKSIKQAIIECEENISLIEEETKSLSDQIFDTKQWSFTFKEFVQSLSVKTLTTLQGYANKFLSDIKSDMRVELSGFKIKSDGSLSDKITAYIVRDGEIKEFGNFSGGERVRLEAAMIHTVQSAINSTHAFGGLQFCSIDEIFESSDSQGIKLLTDSYLDMKQSLLLTTHVQSNQFNCKVLKVTKTNKVSTIEYIN